MTDDQVHEEAEDVAESRDRLDEIRRDPHDDDAPEDDGALGTAKPDVVVGPDAVGNDHPEDETTS